MGRPVGILGGCCNEMGDIHSFQSGFIVLGILFVAKDGYGWVFVHNCFLRVFKVTLKYAETGFGWMNLRMFSEELWKYGLLSVGASAILLKESKIIYLLLHRSARNGKSRLHYIRSKGNENKGGTMKVWQNY